MGIKTKLPMGIEDFKRIRSEEFYYIDKTGLIRELLENEAYVNLFTRPRRFGKSMAADMLAAYYAKDEDSSDLFQDFGIRQTELYKAHLNQYDVIKINMQEFLSATDSADEMLGLLQSRIIYDYICHKG